MAGPIDAELDRPKVELSRSKWTGWAMLAVAGPLGAWLVREVHRTIGLDSPRLWELLKTDRVFDLAMLDFFLTAAWAALVLIERANWKDWRPWVALPVFCVVPTLGIILFLLLDRSRKATS